MFNLVQTLELIKTNAIDDLFLYGASYINYAAQPSKVTFNVSPTSFGVNNRWINIDHLSGDLIVGTSEDLIVIYNITEKRVVKAINNGEYVDRLLCVNENRFLTADRNNQLKLWDASSGNLIRVISIIASSIKKMVLLPNNCIATSSYDKFIRLWHLDTGALIPLVFKGHEENVDALYLHNKRFLYSSSIDRTIRVWDIDTAECLKIYNTSDFIDSITLDIDDNIIAATMEGAIYRFSTNYKNNRLIKPFSSEVVSLSVLPDGSIFTGSGYQGGIIHKTHHSVEQFINSSFNCYFSRHIALPDGKIVAQDLQGNLVLLSFPERDINFYDVVFLLELIRENKSIMSLTLPDLKLTESDKEHYKYQISRLFESKPEVGLVLNNQIIHRQDALRI